jgi:hypothetical protein
MLAFQNGWPIVLTKEGRRFVICNGAMGPEKYPGAMVGDLVYGGMTTTGCGSIIDITESGDCHPSCGCGLEKHGALPQAGVVVQTGDDGEAEA